MTHLSDEQVAHLRSRLGAAEEDPWPWSDRWDRQARLPVFVLIVTQYIRGASADLSKDAAIAFVRDAVLNEAIEESGVDAAFFEEIAAQWIHSSGEVTVRDVARTHDLRSAVSRCRMLAVDARGYLSFRVPEVGWSLAARYLERDIDRFAAVVEDPIALHRWMPAVEVVIRSGEVDAGNELLHVLAIHSPGLVQRLLSGMSPGTPDRDGDREHEVRRIERAMDSWLRGIGPLKELAIPHWGDAYPKYQAMASPGGVSSGWRGLPMPARVCHRNRPWMGRHWEWSVTSDDLTNRLSEVLRYGLPPLTSVARHEAEFELATRVTRAPKVASLARAIKLAELEAALAGDFQNVALMQEELIKASRTVAQLLIQRLEERGETVIEPPWAPGDDPEPPGWVWDGWTIDALIARGCRVSRAALDIYNAIVDRWFPAFREELSLARLWPVRLLVFVNVGQRNGPMISWSFEPLERGAEIEVDWRRGSVGSLDFRGSSIADVVRRRPDLEGRYFHSVRMGHLGLFEINPATATAMHWLLSDLQSLKWVTGIAHGTPQLTGRALAIRTTVSLASLVVPPP